MNFFSFRTQGVRWSSCWASNCSKRSMYTFKWYINHYIVIIIINENTTFICLLPVHCSKNMQQCVLYWFSVFLYHDSRFAIMIVDSKYWQFCCIWKIVYTSSTYLIGRSSDRLLITLLLLFCQHLLFLRLCWLRWHQHENVFKGKFTKPTFFGKIH